MTQPLVRPEGEPDRRRATRSALRLNATMRTGGRSRVQVRVIDISTHGCRIACSANVAGDAWVWLSIAGLETQYCRVVWYHQEFIGLEFATPLSELVLDRLMGAQAHLPETAINELREIASRTHGLAVRAGDEDIQILAEMSRKCAVDAIVEGFRLGESAQPSNAKRKGPPA